MKRNYYKTLGWDERGIPTKEILEKLGLGDVDKHLKKLRK
jgi:aldehyde:ferredoxin oxidoreductase